MEKKESMLDVFKRNQYNLHQASKQSADWFAQQVLLMTKQHLQPRQVMRSESLTMRGSIIPGEMYMFLYDAKTKDKLPYWDQFPLVLPFAKEKDGFIGLNLHYLPYQLRAQLLDKLLFFKNSSTLDERTKLRYSWNMISGVSKYRAAVPCVKRYLDEHLRSTLRKVGADNWGTAMMLPVEQFTGANKYSVWAESKQKIRNSR